MESFIFARRRGPGVRRDCLARGRSGWHGLLLAPLLSLAAAVGEAGLVFNLTDTGNASANAGFRRAADFIAARFDDDITVNITAGFASLDPGILGEANSSSVTATFSNWKAAIATDRTTADDNTFSANLPVGSSFSLYLNRTANNPNGAGSATPYLDNDGDANNTTVRLNRANAKALGLLAGADGGADAAITFSSDFAFDFDPSDGISPGQIDFVGVAIHEIMHAMGFVSGVDILDINSPPVHGPFDDNLFTYVYGLDFTRHSVASLAAGADIDWTADTRTKLYSLDGGATVLIADAWSTGYFFGDGRQASHWRDDLGIGILDPTAAPPGNQMFVTVNDLQALDVIGWDPVAVPEPSTWALAAAGLTTAVVVRRRRRAG